MLARAGAFMVRLLWPDRCAACQVSIEEGQIFCDLCQATVIPLETACPACALPADGVTHPRCRACGERPFPFSAARACLLYGGAVADAIVRFKHGGSLALGRSLGRALVPLLDWAAEAAIDAVLPVPLHPARLRGRGFNQALELLREASRHRARQPARPADRPRALGAPRLAVWPSALVRRRDTPPLGRESPAVRRSRLSGAFAVAQPARVRGRRLLVVDDVMTSGATLAECAQTLYTAGARDVLVGALARAARPNLPYQQVAVLPP
jgi:predicted amidophosphoribosyltransferase